MKTDKGTKTDKRTRIDEERFTKDQILSSARYAGKRDIIRAVLEENKQYDLSEVDQIIENYMKGKVK